MQDFCEKAAIDFITQDINVLDFFFFLALRVVSVFQMLLMIFFPLFFGHLPDFKVTLLKYRNTEN